MTIDYTVSEDGKRINTHVKGILDINTTIDYFGRISNDINIKPGAVEIVDFKDVTDFKISYVESERITRSFKQPKGALLIAKTVFVCENDLAYGIGRMLQTFHNITNPDHDVTVVHSLAELSLA